MHKNKGEYVVLFDVQPDGFVEGAIMSVWSMIIRRYHITESAVQLGKIWNKEYNRYVIKCDTINNLKRLADFLADNTFKLFVSRKNIDEFCPMIKFAKELPA